MCQERLLPTCTTRQAFSIRQTGGVPCCGHSISGAARSCRRGCPLSARLSSADQHLSPAVTQQGSPLHLAWNAALHLPGVGTPFLQRIMLMPACWGTAAHDSTPLPRQTAALHLCLEPLFAAPPSPTDGWWPLTVPMRWSRLRRPGTCLPAAASCCAAQSRRPLGSTSSWLRSVSLPGWEGPAAPCLPVAEPFWSPPATSCRHRVGGPQTAMQYPHACPLHQPA